MWPSTRPSTAAREARRGAHVGAHRTAAGLLLALACAHPASAQAPSRLVTRPLGGLRAEAATLLVQGLPGGSLPLAVAALDAGLAPEPAPEAGGPARLRVNLVVEVPGAALLTNRPETASPVLTLELYVYAMTPGGAVVGWLGRAAELDLAAIGEPLWATGVKLAGALDLPPGALELRFLVLDPELRRFGLANLPLELAAAPAARDELRVGPPRGVETCSEWIEAAAGESDGPGALSARPVFRAGGRGRVTVSVAPPAAGLAAPPSFEASFRPRGGDVAGAEPARILGRRDGPRGSDYELEVPIPALEEGVYELTLTAAADGLEAASAPLESWLLAHDPPSPAAGAGDPACAASWSRVLERAMASAGGTRPALPAAADGEGRKAARERQAAAYVATLRRFAAGADLAAAAVDLGATEEALFAIHREAPALLLEAELEVAGRLARAEPQALPALLLLHHQAYLEHLGLRRFGLAGHSRDMVVALADLLLEVLPGADGRSLAADMLASLGDYAERNRLFSLSRLLLERAVEIEPDHQPALLVLAVSYERVGLYANARRVLEHLVELDSGNMEALLRLSVMLDRTGAPGQARERLRTILRRGASGWILSLAYQRLTLALLDDGRTDEALALLEQGVRQLSGDRQLDIQLAYALDRAGRWHTADRRLAELDLARPFVGRTPRHRYTEPPAAGLDAVRAELDRSIVVRLPLLDRALREADLPEAEE